MRYLNAAALWFAFGLNQAAFADVKLRDVGCYRVSGQIFKISNRQIDLLTYKGTRSEELVHIQVIGADGKWKKSDRIALVVFAGQSGDTSRVPLSADKSDITESRNSQRDIRNMWEWAGERRNEKCSEGVL